MKNVLVGYDIGGTKIEVVLVQKIGDSAQVISKRRGPTERDKGYDHILKVMNSLLTEELSAQKLTLDNVESIGLAMPGSVDPHSGEMTLGNTHVLENKNIRNDFKKLLATTKDIPIRTENDANCFAWAEYHMGESKKKNYKNIVGVILGTGVGGGIIVDGKILKGRRGNGGEIGHTFLKTRDIECYCGQKDCVEMFISGPAFEKYYAQKTSTKKPLKEIFQEPGFIDIYKKDLGMFLGRLTNVLDPDAFILGGGISLEKKLYENISELMIPHLFYKKNPPAVLQHSISDSAGGIGAALLT